MPSADPAAVAIRGSWWRHAPLGADPWHRPAVPASNRWQRGHVVGAPVPGRLARDRVGRVVPPPRRERHPADADPPRELWRWRVDLERCGRPAPGGRARRVRAAGCRDRAAPRLAARSSASAKRCTGRAGRRWSRRRRRGRAGSCCACSVPARTTGGNRADRAARTRRPAARASARHDHLNHAAAWPLDAAAAACCAAQVSSSPPRQTPQPVLDLAVPYARGAIDGGSPLTRPQRGERFRLTEPRHPGSLLRPARM